MVQLSIELVKRLHCKNGHRIRIFGMFTRGMWFAANKKGAAAYPYQAPGQTDSTNKFTSHKDDEGLELLMIQDPHKMDMSDASKEDKELLELLQGIAVKIVLHKTGKNYPCWLWFSQFDQVYIRYYEEVAPNFMEANQTRTEDLFFIKSLFSEGVYLRGDHISKKFAKQFSKLFIPFLDMKIDT